MRKLSEITEFCSSETKLCESQKLRNFNQSHFPGIAWKAKKGEATVTPLTHTNLGRQHPP